MQRLKTNSKIINYIKRISQVKGSDIPFMVVFGHCRQKRMWVKSVNRLENLLIRVTVASWENEKENKYM